MSEHDPGDSPEVAPTKAAFLPVARMEERVDAARNDSDVAYFLDLMYFGEMALKMLVVEIVASIENDRDHHRYALEYRLLRANSLGEWAQVLDEAIAGPASQHIVAEGRESQRELTATRGPGQEWQRQAVLELNTACRLIDSTVEDLSRNKVSMRQWAKLFVWLRNRTRGHGASRSGPLSEACPHLRLSIDAIVKNAPAFLRSWVHLRQSLSSKYKVTCFGGDREPFIYLARETGHSLPDGAYVFLDRPRAAQMLFTDPDLTDFFLPNGNFRDATFESISYITDERRVRDGSRFVLPAHAQPASETTAATTMEVVGTVFTNMPPRRDGYVPRDELESELDRVLRDDRHPIITLQGRGGVGKTSLALEVLHQFARSGEVFAIVWFSARDIDLLPQGPKVVRPDVLATSDIALDLWKLMRSEPGPKPPDAVNYFTECLSGQADDGPFLFVFDNFETLRDPAELYSLLDNAIRLPNKVVITTRARAFKADYPIEVRGMNSEEFAALVAETTAKLGISHLIDASYEEQLFAESDGHPYITKVLLGEIAKERRQIALKRVVAAKDGMLDALFDRSFAALSAAAQRVFLTLCSWRSLVPRVGLEAVLMRPGNEERLDVGRALEELEQASLIERDQGVGNQEFLSVPLVAATFGKRKLVTSPFKIVIEADLELIRAFGATSTTDLAHGIDRQIRAIAKVAASAVEEGSDPSQLFAALEYMASEYPPVWLVLAELQQYQLRDLEAAIQSMNRYLESRQSDREAWGRLIRLYRSSGDFLAEMHAWLQLAELERPTYADISSAATRLNGLLYRKELALDNDERRLMVRKLRSLMESRHAEANAEDLSRLAWLCLSDHDSVAARRWTEMGLQIDPDDRHCLGLKRRLDGWPGAASSLNIGG